MVRILTSGVFWKNYHRLTFIVHLPLPLQIMGIRFLMKVCIPFPAQHTCNREEDDIACLPFTEIRFCFVIPRV